MEFFRQNTRIFGALVCMGLLSLGGWSCSGKKVDENDPVSLLEDAESDIKSDHFAVALEKLRMIKNKFPYSSVTVDATLRIADVYFLQESFTEAAASYELFRDLYPKHEKVAYAMLRIGKSHYKDMPATVARDLSSGYRARDAYEAYLRRFGSQPDAEEARQDLAAVLQLLAEKELYIGQAYQREGYRYSARPRYKKAKELYPDTPAAKEASERLEQIGTEATEGETPTPDKPIKRFIFD